MKCASKESDGTLHPHPPPSRPQTNQTRHLRPSALSVLTRPNVLITDAHNAMMEVDSRKVRETKLITTIMDTVRGGGNVLLPTDTAGESSTERHKDKKNGRAGQTYGQMDTLAAKCAVLFPETSTCRKSYRNDLCETMMG